MLDARADFVFSQNHQCMDRLSDEIIIVSNY